MGMMADDCFDIGMEQQIEYDTFYIEAFAMCDAELKDACKISRKPIICDIRSVAYPLSRKQKHILATWYADYYTGGAE